MIFGVKILKEGQLQLNRNSILINLIPPFPIYLNLKSKIENPSHTTSGIMANLKKPGLVDEALGNLPNLTPDS